MWSWRPWAGAKSARRFRRPAGTADGLTSRMRWRRLSRFLPSTVTTEDSVSHNYTDFFPSAMISYNLNSNNTFNLTYARRIDRPSYQDLNPFEVKLDELTYWKGNAFLLRETLTDIK